jgi:hypothetical protein
MGWILVCGVTVGFAVVLTRIQLRRRGDDSRRTLVLLEPVTYRCRVPVKYLLQGTWSLKTLAGMELVVRQHSAQVTLVFPWLGAVLGCNWYFRGEEGSVETGRLDPPLGEGWLALRGQHEGSETALALQLRGHKWDAWQRLVDAGFEPISDVE